MKPKWKLQVRCVKCDYAAYNEPIDEAGSFGFSLDADCPACTFLSQKGLAPAKGASRWRIWRETRAFRRQLQATQPTLPDGS